jgi:hypothetical protein
MYSSFHDWIIEHIPHGSNILELGSGPGTIKLSKYFTMYSIEHDRDWVGRDPKGTYIHAPIVNGWYNRQIVKNNLPLKYNMLLIDGPTGTIGRHKVLDNLDLFNLDVPIVFDDTNRKTELQIFKKMLTKLPNRKHAYFKGPQKDFAVIYDKNKDNSRNRN